MERNCFTSDRSNISDLVELDGDVYNHSLVLLNKLLQRMNKIMQPYGKFL